MEVKQTRVAIYCRLSEEDRDKQGKLKDSNSIQNQKALLIEYAKEQGWNIYQVYSDDNYVGSDRKRPDFNRLLMDAKQLKFDVVLCKTQSRFTREMELVEKYIHGLFPIWGIRFISLVDHADTASIGNKKARQINGLINEWYLEDMSENIKMVLDNRRKNGYHIGASALYGYKKDRQKKGHLIPDREAAVVVSKIFELYADGYGKTAIARYLNEQKIPPPSVYKQIKGGANGIMENRNVPQWKYGTIDRILRNEMYIGNMVQGKYGSVSYKTKKNKPKPKEQWFYVKGTHVPIIEQHLWSLVQNQLAAKAKPYVTGTTGILAGKVRCANCHASMRTVKSRGYRYYRCSQHYINKELCQGTFIAEEALEQSVFRELEILIKKYLGENIETQINKIREKTKEKPLSHSFWICELNESKKLRQRFRDLEYAIQELYIDKAKREISEEEYQRLLGSFKKEQLQIQKSLEAIERKAIEEEGREKVDDSMNNASEVIRWKRKWIESVVSCIYVGQRIVGSNQVVIEINWNL